MENCTQQCSVSGSLSDSSVLTCGVPRGRGWGVDHPRFTVILIKQKLTSKFLSNCKPRMYADETHLPYANNDVGNIESCLTLLKANKLTLNMTKTAFMLRGSGQRLNTLTASPSCSHNGLYSDETGFNHEIIWCNNWRQTRFSYKKEQQKNGKFFFSQMNVLSAFLGCRIQARCSLGFARVKSPAY